MDRQCSSCGGFCKKSGCERENITPPQPEPEPVAWLKKDRSSIEVSIMSAEYMKNAGFEPLYTAPPQREWQGLTAYEIQELHLANPNWGNFACAIEAKLKEKNT